MKIEINEVNEFKQVINALAVILDDATTFIISPETGLCVRQMDKSRFILIDLTISPSYFEMFEVDKEYLFTIDIRFVKQILQRAKGIDKIVLTLDENHQVLKFDFIGSTNKHFILPLLASDPLDEVANSPDILFAVKSTIDSAMLKELIQDAAIINPSVPYIQIFAHGDKLSFSSVMDKKNFNIALNVKNDDVLLALELDKDNYEESQYSTTKFKEIIVLNSLASVVDLFFSTSHPLKIHYNIRDVIDINYLLAPQLPEDVEEEETEDD